jgi:SAM-dependent methyltransferase
MSSPSRITNVSHERWQQAQSWELALWERAEQKEGWRRPIWHLAGPVLRRIGFGSPGDDWNKWWSQQFDGYEFVPTKLGSLVELGCGPYTNARMVAHGREVDRVVCSDPLIEHYVRYRGTWLNRGYREGKIEIDASALENTQLSPSSFDVVVLINVLDHVRDALLCLERAAALVAPGGFFLLGQDLSNQEDVAIHPEDVGHPIRLGAEELRPHLRRFEPVLDRLLPRENGRNPDAHCGTLIFAGRRALECEQ